MIDTVLIDKAIAHITNQMMKDKREVIRVIEEHLTGVCKTKAVAEKILVEGKTLDGAYRRIEDEARKQRKSNCVCIDPWTGFALVEEYYGITGDDKKEKPIKKPNSIDIMDFI